MFLQVHSAILSHGKGAVQALLFIYQRQSGVANKFTLNRNPPRKRDLTKRVSRSGGTRMASHQPHFGCTMLKVVS